MKSLNIKQLILTIMILLLIILIPNIAQAAGSFSISKSSASLTNGGTTTITVSASNCAGQFTVSSSNASVATVSTSSIWLDNSSQTITVTAKGVGTATISIKAVDVTDTDLNDITATKTCSITVSNPVTPPSTTTTPPSTTTTTTTKPPTTTTTTQTNQKPVEEKKSNDANLKSLVIEGYELYPAFDTQTKEYNLKVGNEVTSVNVIPEVNDQKASYKIVGEPGNLQVGKNEISIIVTAEDGTTNNYKITITREREGLSVQLIKVTYKNEEGNIEELVLNPEFNSEIKEYTLQDVSYLISKLDIAVTTNLEEAIIEIVGNDELKEGENVITITAIVKSETEEQDEILTYTIKVNKEKAPVVTAVGKINSFITNNFNKIIVGALSFCSVALAGLTVYLIIDYKKYRILISKIAEITKINNTNATTTNAVEMAEKGANDSKIKTEDNIEDKKRGRHF